MFVRQQNSLKKYGFFHPEETPDDLDPRFCYEHAFTFHHGLVGVQLNKKWGFLDEELNIQIPIQYDDVWSFQPGGFGPLAVVKLNGRLFKIDNANNIYTMSHKPCNCSVDCPNYNNKLITELCCKII